MEDEGVPQSPGLNMEHGFIRQIENNQLTRDKQAKEEVARRNRDSNKFHRKVGFHAKPAIEIYRPPSLRTSGEFSLTGSDSDMENYVASFTHPQLQSSGGNNGGKLSKSKSTSHAHRVRFQLEHHVPTATSTSNITTQPLPSSSSSSSTSSAINSSLSEGYILKRSRTYAPGELKSFSNDLDLSGFSVDVQSTIKRAIQDPNQLAARQLMEIVRHLFNRVLESVRYAEPTARLCITIIQKEKNETFLESLLNSCREWYNERDRLASLVSGSNNQSAQPQPPPPVKPNRWVAYVTFLYELYTRLKSRKQSPMVATNTMPSTVVLTLLTECCLLFLRPTSLMGHGEIECLFIVLTSVGRDLATECPQRMQSLMSAVREAFLVPDISPSVHKTLLQLIELNASHWQMMAPAVTYYYPGNQRH